MPTVRILPTRTHLLAGQRVEAGAPVDVPADAAELALRHGWAVPAPQPAEAPRKHARRGEHAENKD